MGSRVIVAQVPEQEAHIQVVVEQGSSHGHDFLIADLLLTLPVSVCAADPSKIIVLEPEPHRVEVRCQGVSVLKESCPVLWAQKTRL